MYLFYEQVAATVAVKTVADLNPPANATHVDIQSDTQNVRYTMDDTTDPTITSGMIFVVGLPIKTFLVEDLKRIRFIRNGGVDAVLNLHYFAGRDI